MNPFEAIGIAGHLIDQLKEIDLVELKAQVEGQIKSIVENIAAMEASQRRTERMVTALYQAHLDFPRERISTLIEGETVLSPRT